MKPLIFRLNHLPDLDIQTYTARYGGEVRAKVMERQESFLYLLHELGMYSQGGDGNGSVASLRYLFNPHAGAYDALRIYLLFNNRSEIDEPKVRNTLLKSPLSEFYGSWEEVRDADEQALALGIKPFSTCVELLKEEATPMPLFKVAERQALEQAAARAASGFSGPSKDEIRRQYSGMTDTAFYYLPLYVVYPFEAAADQNMLWLDRYLSAYETPFMLEVSVRAARPSEDEILAVEKMINYLERVKGFSLNREGEDRFISLRNDHQDFTAEAIADIFEEYHEKLTREPYFEFAVKIWGEDADLASILAGALARECNTSGKYRKLVLKEGHEDFTRSLTATRAVEIDSGIRWREYWDESWDASFYETDVFAFNSTGMKGGAEKKRMFSFLYNMRRLPRLARLESIASFFRLPVPGPEPLQTMRKESEGGVAAGYGERSIVLGKDCYKPALVHNLALEQLKKHMFVSGVPGSGKTTAIFNMLVQLHEQGIPFMIFEPAKTEYRLLKRLKTLAEDGPKNPAGRNLGEVLQVYTLGQEHLSPLRFNPFEFPEGITLDEHVGSLEACFKGALPISTGPLPALINEAVDEIYAERNWMGITINNGERAYPTLAGLYQEIQKVFERKNYSGDVRGDLQTAIEVRIGSLLRRSIGRIFDAGRSLPDIRTLMTTPCVIELDALNEEQTSLMIMFLMAQIREFVRANRRSGDPLSHVIVLEEAHNVIGKANENNEEGGNPKAEATKYIVNFLAEVRALGEGIIIADQLPSAVAPEVIKNTNIKLAHRIVSGDDREELGLTMLLDPNQFEDMARLPPGEAYLYQEGMYKPVRIKGEYVAAQDRWPILAEPPPDGAELLRLIRGEAWHEAILVEKLQQSATLICDTILGEQAAARSLAKDAALTLAEDGAGLSELGRLLIGLTAMINKLEDTYEANLHKWESVIGAFPAEASLFARFRKTEAWRLMEILADKQSFLLEELNGLRRELMEIAEMLPPAE